VQVTRGGAQLCLEVSDSSHVGACRRAAQRLAETWRFDETGAGRVGVVASELATNLLKHATAGVLLAQPVETGTTVQIELLAVDRGPGMASVDECLRDGYSTGGTSGTGLGAVRRMSAVFDIYSQLGKGSIVLARVASSAGPSRSALLTSDTQFGAVSIPISGESECGDIWSVAADESRYSLLVADGLGHGPLAAVAAAAAADAYAAQPFDPPQMMMQMLHRRLGGTRGAAAAYAVFDESVSKVRYAGIGNIAGCIIAPGMRKGLMSHNGTLGLSLSRSLGLDYDWPARAMIVMHSDGLSNRWSLEDYPGLAQCHPAVIAAALYRDFSRDRDDSTVVVLRRLP
jgi:anti-sigma regulatory factor (Ser/Thr protein kinase)